MKRKIQYIIAGVFCVLGLLCILGSAVVSDFSFSEMTGHPVTRSEFTLSSDVTKIVVQDEDVYVHIVSSVKDEISVTTLCGDRREYDITEYSDSDGKVAAITKTDLREWYDFIFNIDFTSQYIEIALPKDLSCKLEITNSSGSIFVERVDIVSMTANAENGSVIITDTSIANDLTVFAEMGTVDLTWSNIGGAAELKSDCGSITLQSVEAAEINAVAEFESIIFKNVVSLGDIIAETDYGYISFCRCEFAGKMSLTSNNGDISGTLIGSRGDYSLRTSAVHGSNSLAYDSDGGDLLVEMYTYNGSIRVGFDSDTNKKDEYQSSSTKTEDIPEENPMPTSDTADATDDISNIPTVTMNYLPIFCP